MHSDPHTHTPPEIKDANQEIPRVIRRLKGLMVPHLESARRLGVVMGTDDFLAVFDALLAEADGLNPQPHLDCAEELRRYVRGAMYEELLEEPSNILYATQINADTVRYDAMPVEFWKQCLTVMRVQIAGADTQTGDA